MLENVDKDGLVYLSDILDRFDYLGYGVFKDKKSELAVIAHQYFRKSLSILNNVNHYFLNDLIRMSKNPDIRIRIALDRNLVGLAKTYSEAVELEFWRGPKFSDDIATIKPGVSVHGASDFDRFYSGISQTEFWWKHSEGLQTLEAEELKDSPSKGISADDYGCRYVHSIFSEENNSFEHFDGAIRRYDTDGMITRLETDIKKAGKYSSYTKLFRVDGKLQISDWKSLVCQYFQGNKLVPEYFGIPIESSSYVVKQHAENKSVVENLVPYSIAKGDGVRLLVSYIKDEKVETDFSRYITNLDELVIGDKKIRVVERDVIEIVKALNRQGEKLEILGEFRFVCTEDGYWNIPTIEHCIPETVAIDVTRTLDAMFELLSCVNQRGVSKVISFSFSWITAGEMRIKIAVLGDSHDVVDWLGTNREIPMDKIGFRNWLESQRKLMDNYPVKIDSPSLAEIVCDDGTFYLRRRCLDREIKQDIKLDEENRIMLGLGFPKDQAELIEAYNDNKIQPVLGYTVIFPFSALQ